MSWGHAVSPDLFRWKHLPVTLPEEGPVMVYSGSAVVDHRNTSGFGKNGKPPMIAIYTSRTEPTSLNRSPTATIAEADYDHIAILTRRPAHKEG